MLWCERWGAWDMLGLVGVEWWRDGGVRWCVVMVAARGAMARVAKSEVAWVQRSVRVGWLGFL